MKTIVDLFMDAPLVYPGVQYGVFTASTQRFRGYLVELDYTLYPRSIDLVCRGPLVRAEIYGYDGGVGAVGYDLARASAGDTDENMVRNVLQYVGLTVPRWSGGTPSPFEVHIGETDATHPDTYPNCGTGQTVGVTNSSQFLWTTGQSAMDYIEALEEIACSDTSPFYGYRTYETNLGTIIRTKIDVAADNSAAATFTEGVDIFQGSGQQQALQIKNRVNVTGYNPGGTGSVPAGYALQQTNPLLDGYQSDVVSSQLVERSQISDAGTGFSCEAACRYRLGQYNRELYKYTLVTPRDDLLDPGQTIAIQMNPGGGIGGSSAARTTASSTS